MGRMTGDKLFPEDRLSIGKKHFIDFKDIIHAVLNKIADNHIKLRTAGKRKSCPHQQILRFIH